MTPGLADFEGAWRLEREIDDRLAGRQGRLTGKARFETDGRGLVYREAGELAFPGQPPLSARQTYLWRADGEGIAVLFGDGRAFHRFDPGETGPSARHDCAPDLYRVTYDFAGWPDWTAVWRVTGPRKDYRMLSRYRRA